MPQNILDLKLAPLLPNEGAFFMSDLQTMHKRLRQATTNTTATYFKDPEVTQGSARIESAGSREASRKNCFKTGIVEIF